MNNELQDLYKQLMTEHYVHPHNRGITGEGKSCCKHNALCGDVVTVEVVINNNIIQKVNHEAKGCLICCSTASLMGEMLEGKTVEQAQALSDTFKQILHGDTVELSPENNKLKIYEKIQHLPARAQCASLAWEALDETLKGEEGLN